MGLQARFLQAVISHVRPSPSGNGHGPGRDRPPIIVRLTRRGTVV